MYSLIWNIRPQSSQLAEPLWTDPGISACELNLHFNKTKQKSAGWNKWSYILPKPLQARKKPPPT